MLRPCVIVDKFKELRFLGSHSRFEQCSRWTDDAITSQAMPPAGEMHRSLASLGMTPSQGWEPREYEQPLPAITSDHGDGGVHGVDGDYLSSASTAE
jgi:hypothetical protein